MFQFAAFETTYPNGVRHRPFQINFDLYLEETPTDTLGRVVYYHSQGMLPPSRVYVRTHDEPITPHWATMAGCMGGE